MAKVEFKRVQTDAEVENIDIKDGQLIYSKSGKTYMDYGNQRIPTGSGGEGGSTEVYIQDTEPTEEDWKLWIDNSEVADNTYYNNNGTATQFKTTTYDTLPVGAEVDYDGQTVPDGWTEIPDPNVYSTSEMVVGTWVDGKPIYKKTVKKEYTTTVGALNTSTELSIPHNISNIGNVIKLETSLFSIGGDSYCLPLFSGSSTIAKGSLIVRAENSNIIFRIINDTWQSPTLYITLYYTKTTD